MLPQLLTYLATIISCVKAEDFSITSSSGIPLLKYPSVNPDFIGSIKNVTVAIGREAVLSCSVTDLGHYKVGWMKADDQTILSVNSRVITHNPRITVTHDDYLRTWQLRIRQLKESDRGCYMCQINTSQMKKQLGCIDVQVPPDIDDMSTSSDVTVSEGDNVTLSCSATGNPDPRILWRREDGDHITLRLSDNEIQKVDTFSGAILQLVRVDRRQMGPYLCIASNDVPPAVSKRVSLFINFAPKVQALKPLIGAPLKSSAKLKCEVEAFPYSNNYWIKELGDILLSGSKYNINEKRNGYKVIMILTIYNITPEDYGTYSCIASNIKGKSDSAIRLYEIRLTTTSTTSTTTTTTTTETPTTFHNLVLEVTNNEYLASKPAVVISTDAIASNSEEDNLDNWLYPSVAPAPLELEPHEQYSSVHSTAFPNNFLLILVSVFTLR